MQHPFEGVLAAAPQATQAKTTRRSFFGKALGAVAALLGLGAAASAQSRGRRPTTLAFGEEGGSATTYAWGEEGGVITTRALYEEGGWRPPPTTYAMFEEGGGWPSPVAPLPPSIRPIPPVRPPTTLAIGEEGGVTYAWAEAGGGYYYP